MMGAKEMLSCNNFTSICTSVCIQYTYTYALPKHLKQCLTHSRGSINSQVLNIFTSEIKHLLTFLLAIQISFSVYCLVYFLCPIFYQIVCLFLTDLRKFFIYSRYHSLALYLQTFLAYCPLSFLFNRFNFRIVLGLQRNEWKVQSFHIPPYSSSLTVSPVISILHSCGTFVMPDEPTQVHYY